LGEFGNSPNPDTVAIAPNPLDGENKRHSTRIFISLSEIQIEQKRLEMVMDLSKLLYAKSHEWAAIEGDICTVGITQFAVEQLTDVTYLQLPKMGDPTVAEKRFGEIESVKAVFELYAPVTGQIIEVNDKVTADPSIINADCYGKGWMIKIKIGTGAKTDHLMSLDKYNEQIAQGH
jgi:glycine cleavage system H protein